MSHDKHELFFYLFVLKRFDFVTFAIIMSLFRS